MAQINKERRKTGKIAQNKRIESKGSYNPLMEKFDGLSKKGGHKEEYLAAARNKMNMFGRNLNELKVSNQTGSKIKSAEKASLKLKMSMENY